MWFGRAVRVEVVDAEEDIEEDMVVSAQSSRSRDCRNPFGAC